LLLFSIVPEGPPLAKKNPGCVAEVPGFNSIKRYPRRNNVADALRRLQNRDGGFKGTYQLLDSAAQSAVADRLWKVRVDIAASFINFLKGWSAFWKWRIFEAQGFAHPAKDFIA
jgi:hypothetical protein